MNSPQEDGVQPPQQRIPDTITLQVICDMKTNQIIVKGPIHIKGLCIKILADAIQIVVDQPAIVMPGHTNGKTPIAH